MGLRSRRLQRQKMAATSKENAKPVSQSDAEAEKAKREVERAEQRKQLLMVQEQLKQAKEARAKRAK